MARNAIKYDMMVYYTTVSTSHQKVYRKSLCILFLIQTTMNKLLGLVFVLALAYNVNVAESSVKLSQFRGYARNG